MLEQDDSIATPRDHATGKSRRWLLRQIDSKGLAPGQEAFIFHQLERYAASRCTYNQSK